MFVCLSMSTIISLETPHTNHVTGSYAFPVACPKISPRILLYVISFPSLKYFKLNLKISSHPSPCLYSMEMV